MKYHDTWKAFCQGSIQTACSELFGESAVLFKEKINYKQPGVLDETITFCWESLPCIHVGRFRNRGPGFFLCIFFFVGGGGGLGVP